MKAMDILFRLAALCGGQVADDLPGWGSIDQLLALWAEYELTTKGGQNTAWSEGLKRAHDVGTDDDQEAADRQAVDAEDGGAATTGWSTCPPGPNWRSAASTSSWKWAMRPARW